MTPYYEQDGITIYHGDCRDLLPSLTRFDLALTDPPYGVGFRGQEWDNEIPSWWFDLVRGKADTLIFTTGPTTLWDYPRPDWVLCWGRPASNSRSKLKGGFSHWSPVPVYGDVKFPVDFLSLHAIQYAQPTNCPHPCPKPQRLFAWIIEHASEPGALVCDPFMGSGTAMAAAKDLGRRAIGIEIEERYCEIAAKRLSQQVLFGGTDAV